MKPPKDPLTIKLHSLANNIVSAPLLPFALGYVRTERFACQLRQ